MYTGPARLFVGYFHSGHGYVCALLARHRARLCGYGRSRIRHGEPMGGPGSELARPEVGLYCHIRFKLASANLSFAHVGPDDLRTFCRRSSPDQHTSARTERVSCSCPAKALDRFLVAQRTCSGVFSWHPLRVESVAWVAERKDVLSTLFMLLTLIAYGKYLLRPTPVRYMLALCTFALG